LSLGKNCFFVELLRSFVSVNRRFFLKFLLFKVLKKFLIILNSSLACSYLYAHAEYTGQELMRTLTLRISSLRACSAIKHISFPIFQMVILIPSACR
jgi:hypothetical protein